MTAYTQAAAGGQQTPMAGLTPGQVEAMFCNNAIPLIKIAKTDRIIKSCPFFILTRSAAGNRMSKRS